MINILRALMHTRTDRQCKQRNGNPEKEPKINARDQKQCNRNGKCL